MRHKGTPLEGLSPTPHPRNQEKRIQVSHHQCGNRYPFCSIRFGKISGLGPATGFLGTVSLSVSSQDLADPSLPHLLYVSVSLHSLSLSGSFCYPALIDSGASVNLIHESLVSSLSLAVEPCRLRATLADGKTALSCTSFVRLSYSIAGISCSDVFFVAPLGAQSLLLGMPYLERENPLIDWQTKTLEPRSTQPHVPPHVLPHDPRVPRDPPVPHDPTIPPFCESASTDPPETDSDSKTPTPPRRRRRLPSILPTKNINPK